MAVFARTRLAAVARRRLIGIQAASARGGLMDGMAGGGLIE